jgi:uncharacterized OsmC-like protein
MLTGIRDPLFRKFYLFSCFKRFSIKISNIRTFKVATYTEDSKCLAKVSSGIYEMKEPMEQVLANAGACEISTIQYYAKKNEVPIEKIEVDLRAEYDGDIFKDKKEGRNTYSKVDVDIKIKSSEKDRKKLEQVINKAIEKCPVVNTLELAGIDVHKKINYL